VVRRALLAYRAGDGQWQTLAEWRDVTEELSAGHAPHYGWIIAGIVGLALVYVAYRILR
jgi:hypothetical protein